MQYGARVARHAGDSSNREAVMAAEVAQSLTASQPSLPTKYLYDDRGSELFEQITWLPEYYQCRTELEILEAHAQQIIATVAPRELVELGAGAGRKIGLLLEAMQRQGLLGSCVLLDINERFVRESARKLAHAYSRLRVQPVVADFVTEPHAVGRASVRRLALFFAGTLGNLPPEQVPQFLRAVASMLSAGDGFLVGVDLVKDRAALEAAYNDRQGVTAEFNLNLLRVMNRRLGADFDLSAFEHVALYNEAQSRIEMRLRAVRPTRVRLSACQLEMRFDAGSDILTEISCKYTRASFEAVVPQHTGLIVREWLTDPQQRFALALLQKAPVAAPEHAP